MKKSLIQSLVLLFLLMFCACTLQTNKQNVLTFQVDMSAANVETDTVVGIRGSMAPLSWKETLPMHDDDGDSIYSVSVEFKDVNEGDRLMYKYMKGETWENDLLGPMGNRVASICGSSQDLSVDIWDVPGKFPMEELLKSAAENEFYIYLNILGRGMKAGASPEELGIEYVSFWGGFHEWINNPGHWLFLEEINAQKFPDGYLEILEDSPGKVVYKTRKWWSNYFQCLDEGETLWGVTESDMTAFFKAMVMEWTGQLNWTVEWEDDGPDVIITIITE